jgi:hypothetical protein
MRPGQWLFNDIIVLPPGCTPNRWISPCMVLGNHADLCQKMQRTA